MMSKRITWGNKCGTSGPDDPEPFEPLRTGTVDLVRGPLMPDPREAAIAELKTAAGKLAKEAKYLCEFHLTDIQGMNLEDYADKVLAALAAVGGGEQ
jgi:hypothetical protein